MSYSKLFYPFVSIQLEPWVRCS